MKIRWVCIALALIYAAIGLIVEYQFVAVMIGFTSGLWVCREIMEYQQEKREER